MVQLANLDTCKPIKAISRSRGGVVRTREIQLGKKLYRIKKFRDGTTTLQWRFLRGLKANNKSEAVDPSTSKPDAIFNDQPPQVNPKTDEKTKFYYHGIGKLEFLLLNYRRGLRSMLKFLEKQVKLKTYKNIEVREIEFGKPHFRVENFGEATTIERILKVKNDV
ncbi:uncharacterized protein [Medicago truncatula]|uniref:uncharacterized protein isoform X2 n=1 Tax=Medicago truncatula TaxID=3880 RepID=UPI0019686847|nr:uncharacterized protein LOC112419103 isoform X2 [Medicago truncatula]